MIKRLFISVVICFIISVGNILAVDTEYQFLGTLQLPDKSLITYKLEFTEVDGIITGQSITDFAGEHRTVTKIEGTFDSKNNTIEFSEIANIATKSDQETNDFCYISLPKGLVKIKKKSSIIQGHFYSSYGDGSTCIEGDMYLIGEKHLFDKMDKLSKNILIKKDSKEKIKNNIEATKKIMTNSVLKTGEVLNVNTKEDNVYIFVWDEQHEDHDRISIYVNGEILKEIEVTKEKKSFKIELNQVETEIEIIAINEGLAPPNTAKLLIANPNFKLPIIVKLKEGENAKITIHKEL